MGRSRALVTYKAMRAVWHPSFELSVNFLEGRAPIETGDPWLDRRIGRTRLNPDYSVRRGVFDADDAQLNCPVEIRPTGVVTSIMISWMQWPLLWIYEANNLPMTLHGGDVVLVFDNTPTRIVSWTTAFKQGNSAAARLRRRLIENVDSLARIDERSEDFRRGPADGWWVPSP